MKFHVPVVEHMEPRQNTQTSSGLAEQMNWVSHERHAVVFFANVCFGSDNFGIICVTICEKKNRALRDGAHNFVKLRVDPEN